MNKNILKIQYSFQISTSLIKGICILSMTFLSAFSQGLIGQVTITSTVNASSDDAEETGPDGTYNGVGFVALNSSDVELVRDDQSPSSGAQIVGIRFNALSIPRGATITNAYISFNALASNSPNTNTGVTNLAFRGNAVDDASTFISTTYDISSRPVTIASVNWSSIGAWTATVNYNTPNLKTIVQEIVNRAGWNSENSLAIIITGSGSRTAESWDNTSSEPPVLTVEYTIMELSTVATHVTTQGGSNGAVSLIVTNGTSPLTYQWSNGATTKDISGLVVGTYTVTVTDANGAISIATENVNNIDVKKQLYLTGTGQLLDRVDPVSVPNTSQFSSGLYAGKIKIGNTTFGMVNNVSSATVSHTTPSETNKLMLVGISIRNISSQTVTSVTYNNVALSLVSTVVSSTNARTYIYSMVDPPSGTYNVVVNFNTSVTRGAVVGVSTFSGINISTPLGTPASTTGSSGNVSLNIPSSEGEYVFSTVTKRNASSGFTTSQTQFWNGYTSESRGAANGTDAHLTNSTTNLSWTSGNGSNFAGVGIAIKPEIGNLTATFTQTPTVCSNLIIEAGIVTVETYVNVVIGTMPANPTITATLRYGSNTIITLTNPTYNSTTKLLSWSATLPSDVTVPTGNAISLDITTSVRGMTFQIEYDSATRPSKVEFNTSTFIDVASMNVYSAPNPSGTIINSAQNGSTVYIRSVVTDPFGFADITGMNLSMTPLPGGSVSAISVATSTCSRTYEYAWTTPTTSGDYVITGTAKEGFENVVTNIKAINFSLCPLTATASVINQPTCSIATGGAANITVSGGAGPYTWIRFNGVTTTSGSSVGSPVSMTGLTSGIYTVTVTSSRGCTGLATFTISVPTSPNASGVSTAPSCFGGSNGTIVQAVSGGISPYSYLWSSGQTTKDRTALAAGTYSVTVTDAGGCQRTATYTVTQPSALSASTQITHPTCIASGSVTLSISGGGGTSPYTWSWSRVSPTSTGSGSGLVISGLIFGTYNITVTSAAGCTGMTSAVLNQALPPTASAFIINPSCFGSTNGALNQSILGGTMPYVYSWADGAGNIQNRVNIASGNYTVTITDTKQCQVVKSYTVTQPQLIAVSGTIQQPQCTSGGSISLNISGGMTPYAANWADIAGSDNIKNRIGLSAGNFTVTVSDINGCSASTSATLSQPICDTGLDVCISTTSDRFSTDPDPMVTSYFWTVPTSAVISSGQGTPVIFINWTGATPGNGFICVRKLNSCGESTDFCRLVVLKAPQATITYTQPLCQGSDLKLFSTGGVKYVWSGPSGFTSESENPTIYNVNATNVGNYNVTVTNSSGCMGTATAYISVMDAPVLAETVYNASCGQNNGFIQLNALAGTAPYTYLWSNGNTTQNNVSLAKGNYKVTVTDSFGCTATASSAVGEVNGPSISYNSSNIMCFGSNTGSISLNVVGGTTPYSFYWSNGSTSEDITSLAAGIYNISVVDGVGCVGAETIELTQPNKLNIENVITNVSCNGGSNGIVDISVAGGAGSYTYNWSNGFTTQDIFNRVQGNYTVTVTDGNICSATFTANINQPLAPVQLSMTPTNVSCFGFTNGLLNLTVSGGTSPYSYSWNSVTYPLFSASSEDIALLNIGNYSVTVTDYKGCTSTSLGTIGTPSQMVLSLQKSNVSCFKEENGLASASVLGGTQPYTYKWSNGSTTSGIENLSSGNYSVIVFDANGCSLSNSIIINEPSQITFSSALTHVNCNNSPTGIIDLSVSGGQVGYQYLWSNGAEFQDLNGLFAGNYTVTITDANSCSESTMITINQNNPFVTDEFVKHVSCNGGADGKIDFSIRGGVGPYAFLWSNGATTEDIENLNEGAYFVNLTDANACTSSSLIVVNEPNSIFALAQSSDKRCSESVDGSIILNVSGGIAPFTYQWSNGSSSQNIQNLLQGTYTVTVTDFNRCTSTTSASVLFPAKLNINGIATPKCPGQSNGSIQLTTSGGTMPYQYSWADNSINSGIRTGLNLQMYSVTVTDANGCSASETYELLPLNVDLFGVNPSCGFSENGIASPNSDGEIYAIATGGTSNYAHSWSNGVQTSSVHQMPNGFFTVSVTSGNCTLTTHKLLAAGSCTPPVGVDEHLVTEINVPLTGNVSLNDYDPDFEYPLTLLPLGYIDSDIGIMEWDTSFNGSFVFTPHQDYVGSFSIPYQVCDTINLCAIARVYITVASPVLGIAKTISSLPVNNGNQSYALTYALKVENLSYISVSDIQVTDDIDLTFVGSVSYTVKSISSDVFSINPGYDGSSDKNLLVGGNSLPPFGTGTIYINVDIFPGLKLGPYNNSATVSGLSPGGIFLTDISQDGEESDPDSDGNPKNNNEPTLLRLCPIVSLTGPDVICVGVTTTVSQVPNGTWISSNPGVANVNNSGVIVGISSGFATFTFIEAVSGCETNATSPVQVLSRPVVSINGDSIICAGFTTQLSPSTGGIWISNSSTVATVTNAGVVSGLTPGNASFYFINTQTGCISLSTKNVQVRSNPLLSFDVGALTCVNGTVNVSPKTNGVWTSSNPLVASITNSGVVTGLSNGISYLSFTTSQGCGRNQPLQMEVRGNTFVQIIGPSSICIGTTTQLSPSIDGVWQSNNLSTATVSADGLVTGVSSGTVTFTFTDNVTGCTTLLPQQIIVHPKPVVSLFGPDNICAGGSTSLSTLSTGYWISNDPQIADISSIGIITGLQSGIGTFTFFESSTGCASEGSLPITVKPKPEILFSGPSEICVGLSTTLQPSSGGTWTSEFPNKATISSQGIVIGIAQGSARFYFTTTATGCSSDYSAFLTINEKPAVAVLGPSGICAGTTTSLLPNIGGVWSTLSPLVASVTNQGIVTGISGGTVSFVFVNSATGCISNATTPVTIFDAPTIAVTGSNDICVGYTTTLSPISGGVWVSENNNVATVSNSGIVKGIAAGKCRFTFTQTSSGCKSVSPTLPIAIKNCFLDDINSTFVNVPVSGNVQTNDIVPTSTIYSQNPVLLSKPTASTPVLVMQQNGTYSFVTGTQGKYIYKIPICILPVSSDCPGSMLEINVSDIQTPGNIPIANPDRGETFANSNPNIPGWPVTLHTLSNDRCINGAGCHLDTLGVTIISAPQNGVAQVGIAGNIIYTPNPGFAGFDILTYKVCVLNEPQNCTTTQQFINVYSAGYSYDTSTDALDDFFITNRDESIYGNVKINDFDREGNVQNIVAEGTSVNLENIFGGKYWINSSGDFTFIPNTGFAGATSFDYSTCDDGLPSSCASATVYILVLDDLTLKLRVYLEGGIYKNNNVRGNEGRPLMRDNLRSNPYTGQTFIPSQDPYSVPGVYVNLTNGYVHKGPGELQKFKSLPQPTDVFAITGQNAIVDWVFIEMRSKSDSTNVLATRSGLLQRDGDIVDVDGVGYLRFSGMSPDTFYIVVRHRNHLGAMSKKHPSYQLLDFSDINTPVFDFGNTKNNGYSYEGLAMNTLVYPGYRALWAGDFNGDRKLKFVNPHDDQNILFFDVLTHPENVNTSSNFNFGYGYFQGDFDLDGKAKYDNPNDDKNLLFSQILLYPLNVSLLSNFNFFIEQVPEAR